MTETPKAGGRRRPTDEEILSAVPKGTKGHEVRVGIFVMLGILSFVFVLFWLTDPATLRGRYILVTEVEHAGGIRRGDPIQMRGVNVGRIRGFEMRDDGRVAISLEMEGRWRIPVDSRTQMGASGIFGGRTMEIVAGASPNFLQPWDTLPGGEGGAGGLMDSATEIGDEATAVLGRLQTLLDQGTVDAVKGSAGELERLLTELAGMTREQRGTLQRLTESLAGTAEGLKGVGPDAARAIVRADSAMAALAETTQNLDSAASALRSLLERMDRGEGTLGRLAQDDALYVNLSRAAESLASLVADVQANPRKYINVSIF